MTALLVIPRAKRAAVLGGTAVVLVASAASMLGFSSASAGDAAVPVMAINTSQLVQATSGENRADLQAVGDEAKLINAALPFSRGPVASARPFVVSGDRLDESRAEECLAQAVYYEAGFEPIEGRRAVAQVVLNRLRHPAFPKSVCGVVYQGARSGTCQFTFVCDGSLYRAPDPDAWRQARAIAQAALAGYVERSVGEATHYHADYVAPQWAPLLAKVTQIGAHIFYRWPGAWGRPQAFAGHYIGEPADPDSLRPARAVMASSSNAHSTVAIYSGPPIPRAANDVGGLLDTSKGWTLSIPDPRETQASASQVIADQQQPKSAAPVAVASAAAPLAAAR